MKAKFLGFGDVELAGKRYNADVVIDGGKIRRRRKKPSKAYRDQFGHTPLSRDEDIPWRGRRLIVGTGADGRLPIMPEVYKEADRKHVEIIAVPTKKACRLIRQTGRAKVDAVLHVTC
jgi:hypothetical protein